MKRATLTKYPSLTLIQRIVRLARISGLNMAQHKEDEKNEIELSNAIGVLEYRILFNHPNKEK